MYDFYSTLLTIVYDSIALTKVMTLPKGASQPNKAIRNRIAVVFHEHELAYIFAKMIREAEHEVDEFTSSRVASEGISSEHVIYLLALSAWRMPGINGIDLALHLSKKDPGIKIIVISAIHPRVPCMITLFKMDLFKMDIFLWKALDSNILVCPSTVRNY